MSVLERLFGRHPKARPEARTCHPGADLPSTRPTDARRIGDPPMMCFHGEDGWVYILDLDTFEYHYGDQSQQLPDPLQRDLDALLPRVTRVRVRSGGMLRGRALAWPVLIDTIDAAAIAALSTCLARRAPVTPEMAVRLGKRAGNRPALWLGMQQAFDVWHAEQSLSAELERILRHATAA